MCESALMTPRSTAKLRGSNYDTSPHAHGDSPQRCPSGQPQTDLQNSVCSGTHPLLTRAKQTNRSSYGKTNTLQRTSAGPGFPRATTKHCRRGPVTTGLIPYSSAEAKSQIKVLVGLCPLKAGRENVSGPLLAGRHPSSPASLHIIFPLCVSVFKFPLVTKTPVILNWDPPQRPHFNLTLNTIYKCSHILRYEGLRLQHMNLGREGHGLPITSGISQCKIKNTQAKIQRYHTSGLFS